MDTQEQQLIDKLKTANNILVTVRNNPNVDLLSACIALALALDKLDKHAAAVFSGDIPSTIEFLKPEETIEQNTDSLRDFIIALDKSKADKLRYKVEDKMVRIFITPYKTSLGQADLEFSQGDFNVDAIVALGAHEQQELDQAITTHGRILHDATVMSINNTPDGNLGSVNWQDPSASSISELVMQVIKALGKDVIDAQIATALLTGIVAETDRFRNEKTTPKTMSLAGELMAAGANQQLVAAELEADNDQSNTGNSSGYKVNGADKHDEADSQKTDDGSLDIDHDKPEESHDDQSSEPQAPTEQPTTIELPSPEDAHISGVHVTPLGDRPFTDDYTPGEDASPPEREYLADDKPVPATASEPEYSEVNPFSMPQKEPDEPLLNRDEPASGTPPPSPAPAPASQALPEPPPPLTPPPSPAPEPFLTPSEPTPQPEPPKPEEPTWPEVVPPAPSPDPVPPAKDDETLDEIEEDVHSPHRLASETLDEIEEDVHSPHKAPSSPSPENLDSARSEVLKALSESPPPPPPPFSLNANPLGGQLHPDNVAPNMDVQVDADGNLKVPTPPPPATSPVVSHDEPAPNPESPANQPMTMPLPSVMNVPPPNIVPPTNSPNASPDLPPPVPPPMMPPNFMNSGH